MPASAKAKATTPDELLPPGRRKVMLSIRKYVSKHGHSPSLTEIADDVGTTFQSVSMHVRRLRASGHLVTTPRKGAPRMLLPAPTRAR